MDSDLTDFRLTKEEIHCYGYPTNYILTFPWRGDKVPSRDNSANLKAIELLAESNQSDGDDDSGEYRQDFLKKLSLKIREIEGEIIKMYQENDDPSIRHAKFGKYDLLKNCCIIPIDGPNSWYPRAVQTYTLYSLLSVNNDRGYYIENSFKYCFHQMLGDDNCAKFLFKFMKYKNHKRMQLNPNQYRVFVHCLCYSQHFIICRLCMVKLFVMTKGFRKIFDIFTSIQMNIYVSNPYPLMLMIRFLNILLIHPSFIKGIFKKKKLYHKLFRFWMRFNQFYLKCKNNDMIHFTQCFNKLFVAKIVKTGYYNLPRTNDSILYINCTDYKHTKLINKKNISDDFILDLMHHILNEMINQSGEYWRKSVYKYLLNHKHFMQFLSNFPIDLIPIYQQQSRSAKVKLRAPKITKKELDPLDNEVLIVNRSREYLDIMRFLLLEHTLDRKTNKSIEYLCDESLIDKKIANETNDLQKAIWMEYKKQLFEIKQNLLQRNYDKLKGATVWGMAVSCSFAKCINDEYSHKLYKCKGCHFSKYCSKRCQKFDWNLFGHRELCSILKQY